MFWFAFIPPYLFRSIYIAGHVSLFSFVVFLCMLSTGTHIVGGDFRCWWSAGPTRGGGVLLLLSDWFLLFLQFLWDAYIYLVMEIYTAFLLYSFLTIRDVVGHGVLLQSRVCISSLIDFVQWRYNTVCMLLHCNGEWSMIICLAIAGGYIDPLYSTGRSLNGQISLQLNPY